VAVGRPGLAAVWRESADLWLEPDKVVAAWPRARLPASGAFESNVYAARGDFRLRQRPLISSYESLRFASSLSSVSTLVTDGDVSDALQRAAKGTGMEPVDDPFGDEKTL
jgi:hypothetical protein